MQKGEQNQNPFLIYPYTSSVAPRPESRSGKAEAVGPANAEIGREIELQ